MRRARLPTALSERLGRSARLPPPYRSPPPARPPPPPPARSAPARPGAWLSPAARLVPAGLGARSPPAVRPPPARLGPWVLPPAALPERLGLPAQAQPRCLSGRRAAPPRSPPAGSAPARPMRSDAPASPQPQSRSGRRAAPPRSPPAGSAPARLMRWARLAAARPERSGAPASPQPQPRSGRRAAPPRKSPPKSAGPDRAARRLPGPACPTLPRHRPSLLPKPRTPVVRRRLAPGCPQASAAPICSIRKRAGRDRTWRGSRCRRTRGPSAKAPQSAAPAPRSIRTTRDRRIGALGLCESGEAFIAASSRGCRAICNGVVTRPLAQRKLGGTRRGSAAAVDGRPPEGARLRC